LKDLDLPIKAKSYPLTLYSDWFKWKKRFKSFP
jgi:hypothetical protein